jgi:uncharacterized protein (TIGR00661 family)
MKNVLVCPLDWGLGHATRCIPIIKILIEQKYNVIIGSDGLPKELLRQEFPELKFINLKGYNISYPQSGSMTWKMITSTPKILFSIFKEHKRLKEIIQKHHIDIVISDNRFGLWNKKIKSIFITHQLRILSPTRNKFIENLLHKINLYFIKKYDECWVPDTEDDINLSGELSHHLQYKKNVFFIGPLSRFEVSGNENINNQYDFIAIISGPEPQRTIFENMVTMQIKNTSLKGNIVVGKPNENKIIKLNENINIISHLETSELQKMILNSKVVICRSGYSSIMDLCFLNKKAILIATPGQTEQEYLSGYLKKKNYFYSISQKDFEINESIKKYLDFSGIQINNFSKLIQERIQSLKNI